MRLFISILFKRKCPHLLVLISLHYLGVFVSQLTDNGGFDSNLQDILSPVSIIFFLFNVGAVKIQISSIDRESLNPLHILTKCLIYNSKKVFFIFSENWKVRFLFSAFIMKTWCVHRIYSPSFFIWVFIYFYIILHLLIFS